MRALDIITTKRNGLPLTKEQIDWFVQGYTHGAIEDYHATALLMSIFFRGMSRQEIHHFTMALVESGEQMNLSHLTAYAVDKHSSGGVGDKTSLIVMPMVAALGIPVAKMSGRGLGHTGGTLDKMESIPNFRTNLTMQEYHELGQRIGLVLAGQTQDLAPADGKLYALRDVTATVDSIPLIASSIMSKKIAGGAQGIVLDVKVGNGAFMPTVERGVELAEIMVEIGVDCGRDVTAIISDMNQPLGTKVGNALEVIESIETLQGHGADDLVEHCVEIATQMVILADRSVGHYPNEQAIREAVLATLHNGQALHKFSEMVEAQGGDVETLTDFSRFPTATLQHTLVAERGGHVQQVSARDIGEASVRLGAGRAVKGASIDPSVGFDVHVKVGDPVQQGQPLLTIHANDPRLLDETLHALQSAFVIVDEPTDKLPKIHRVIRSVDMAS